MRFLFPLYLFIRIFKRRTSGSKIYERSCTLMLLTERRSLHHTSVVVSSLSSEIRWQLLLFHSIELTTIRMCMSSCKMKLMSQWSTQQSLHSLNHVRLYIFLRFSLLFCKYDFSRNKKKKKEKKLFLLFVFFIGSFHKSKRNRKKTKSKKVTRT